MDFTATIQSCPWWNSTAYSVRVIFSADTCKNLIDSGSKVNIVKLCRVISNRCNLNRASHGEGENFKNWVKPKVKDANQPDSHVPLSSAPLFFHSTMCFESWKINRIIGKWDFSCRSINENLENVNTNLYICGWIHDTLFSTHTFISLSVTVILLVYNVWQT